MWRTSTWYGSACSNVTVAMCRILICQFSVDFKNSHLLIFNYVLFCNSVYIELVPDSVRAAAV